MTYWNKYSRHKTYIHITTLLFIILFCGNLFSQQDKPATIGSGTIIGHVTDSTENIPISDATVLLRGINKGAMTDSQGFFKILNIPPGIYTIHTAKIFYDPKEISNIEIKSGDTLSILIELKSFTFEDYAEKAKTAIKDGHVYILVPGLVAIHLSVEEQNSITIKYGFKYAYVGCTFDPSDANSYNNVINEYLEKRNGKDWEERMDREIQEKIAENNKR